MFLPQRAIFWPFQGKGGYRINPAMLALAWNIPGHNDLDLGTTNLKDHVLAMKRALFWPFLGEGATVFSQQSEIWHGASLGTLVKIQEDPI